MQRNRIGHVAALAICLTAAPHIAAAQSGSPAPLTTAAEVRALPRAEVSAGRPVALRGVVVFVDEPRRALYLRSSLPIPLASACTGLSVTRASAFRPRSSAWSSTRLVEDNIVNRVLATRLLEKHGHEVITVTDGRAALAAIEREAFDVVLMDVQMPEMDGFEATAAVRAREAGTDGHLPIVAMTAHAMEGDRARCLEAGMDGYVAKPIDVHALLTAIDRAVAGQPACPLV